MTAIPLIPGFLYRVSGAGRTRIVSARTGAQAICRAVRLHLMNLKAVAK